MTELRLRNGDYVVGSGALQQVSGKEALLQRVMFRLCARRGRFPFLPELGSRLWQLSHVPAAQRQSAAEAFVAEALSDETVSVERVELADGENGVMHMTVALIYQGEELAVTLNMQ